jgi:hypothetical protein
MDCSVGGGGCEDTATELVAKLDAVSAAAPAHSSVAVYVPALVKVPVDTDPEVVVSVFGLAYVPSVADKMHCVGVYNNGVEANCGVGGPKVKVALPPTAAPLFGAVIDSVTQGGTFGVGQVGFGAYRKSPLIEKYRFAKRPSISPAGLGLLLPAAGAV